MKNGLSLLRGENCSPSAAPKAFLDSILPKTICNENCCCDLISAQQLFNWKLKFIRKNRVAGDDTNLAVFAALFNVILLSDCQLSARQTSGNESVSLAYKSGHRF